MSDNLRKKIESYIRDNEDFSSIKNDTVAQKTAAECLYDAITDEPGYYNEKIQIDLNLYRDMLLKWVNQTEEKISLDDFIYREYIILGYDDDAQIMSNIAHSFVMNLEKARLTELSSKIRESDYFFEDLSDAELFSYDLKWNLVDPPLRVNLILAVGDEVNSDFSNTFVLKQMLEGTLEPGADDVHDCGLAWLIRQQGYSFKNLITDHSQFLDSVEQELLDSTSSMNALTVCLQMDEKDLEAMLDTSHNIKIDKKATVGLYNPWSGSGGTLEIKLEKDLIINRDMIHDIQIEGERHDRVSQNNGYTVDETYGLTRRCWQRWYSPTSEPVHVVTQEEKTEDIEFLKEYCREQEENLNVSP